MAAPRCNYEQKQPITTTLRNICQSYPQDTVLRELLQNADDAGATEVTNPFPLTIDLANHSVMMLPSHTILSRRIQVAISCHLACLNDTITDIRQIEYVLDTNTYPGPYLHSELQDYHGPALLSRNNAVFADKDFASISSVGDSVKASAAYPSYIGGTDKKCSAYRSTHYWQIWARVQFSVSYYRRTLDPVQVFTTVSRSSSSLVERHWKCRRPCLGFRQGPHIGSNQQPRESLRCIQGQLRSGVAGDNHS